MINPTLIQQRHLLLRRAHEKKPGRIQQKWRQVLERARIIARLVYRRPILQHKADLNHARQARAHQRVPKHAVQHRADLQMLRVAAHGVAGEEDDDAGDEVALGPAVALAAEPDA